MKTVMTVRQAITLYTVIEALINEFDHENQHENNKQKQILQAASESSAPVRADINSNIEAVSSSPA